MLLFFKLFNRFRKVQKNINRNFWIKYYRYSCKGNIIIDESAYWQKRFNILYDLSKIYLEIEHKVGFRDNCNILIKNGGKLIIRYNTFFNNNTSLNCLGSIEIGSNCQFGESVKLYDHNHQYRDTEKLISQQGYTIGTIKIGNNCWIGSNVIILKDVEIGDNVIIGAGCVIYKSIPSNSIVINKQNLSLIEK